VGREQQEVVVRTGPQALLKPAFRAVEANSGHRVNRQLLQKSQVIGRLSLLGGKANLQKSHRSVLESWAARPLAPSETSSFPLIPRSWLARAEKEYDTFLGTRSLSLRGSALTCETKKNKLCFYLGDTNKETLAICRSGGASSKNNIRCY